MTTFSKNLQALEHEEAARPAHPVVMELASAARSLSVAGSLLDAVKKTVPTYTGQHSPESYYAEEQDCFNRAAERYADAIVAVVAEALPPAVPHEPLQRPTAPDILEAASYLAINILNSGNLQYAKDAVAATLSHERLRCVQMVGKHFPQTDDERAENAILDIEKGTILR